MLVPVYNEERHIRETVAAMQAQRFDGQVELLFADGGRSEDSTREILLELAASDPRIRVLDNPRRRTASGLNVCLREARGEFVARMDAHTYYADRYLAAGVERLRRGDTEWVSGPAVPRPVGPISRAVGAALASWLGRGGSRKWNDEPRCGRGARPRHGRVRRRVAAGARARGRRLGRALADQPGLRDGLALLGRGRAPGVPAGDGRLLRSARLA